LKKGAVVTIEPGIYLPDEAIGIRIEDDIVVTANGRKNLSKAIPKTIAEIEKAMRN
jgi:Xaa-Pro aminopeptidase